MNSRRFQVQPSKTPTLTGGDDRPQPACAGNPEPYDILMDNRSGIAFNNALEAAKAMCATCPLFAKCLPANEDEQWARAILGRQILKDPQHRDTCGTRQGYKQHSSNGEVRCDDCQRWNREHVAAVAARKRAREAA